MTGRAAGSEQVAERARLAPAAAPALAGGPAAEEAGRSKGQRQVLKYSLYKVAPEWRRLPKAERERGKQELLAAVAAAEERMIVRSYSLVGLRGDADFLLWQIAARLEDVQALQARINGTALAGYLTMPYSYLALTRRSIYVARHVHEGQEGTRLERWPGNAPYLFVYPFVKARSATSTRRCGSTPAIPSAWMTRSLWWPLSPRPRPTSWTW